MCIVHITGDIASCKLCGLNTKCNIVHRYILAVQNLYNLQIVADN